MQWEITILPFPEVEVSETFVLIADKESITYLDSWSLKRIFYELVTMYCGKFGMLS